MTLLQRMSGVRQSHMVCHLGRARAQGPSYPANDVLFQGTPPVSDAKIHGNLPMLLHTHASMTRSVASMGESWSDTGPLARERP